jgi:hypothetical protein
MKTFLGLVLLLIAPRAFACELGLTFPAQMPLVAPATVSTIINVDHGVLTADFFVQNANDLNAKAEFGPKDYPYKYDVVELFVTLSETGFPYYEMELSPYNQTFQVKVVDLKKPFIEGIDFGMTGQAQPATGGSWSGRISLPLDKIGWDGDMNKIRGNAYAILGKSPKRAYLSLFLPPLPKPNFHQPQYFRSLLMCGGEDRS